MRSLQSTWPLASMPGRRESRGAPMPMLCLPWAGGSAFHYAAWRRWLPPWIEARPVELPGRWTRSREPALVSVEAAVEWIDSVHRPGLTEPFVVFGYSLGALVAFELARHLARRHGRVPALLIVAAAAPPERCAVSARLSRLPDDDLLHALERRHGSIPLAVARDPELRALALAALRSDLRMAESYRYEPGPRLSCRVLAIGSDRDRSVPPEAIEAWRVHTTAAFDRCVLPGGHFFLETAADAFRRAIDAHLHRHLAPGDGGLRRAIR